MTVAFVLGGGGVRGATEVGMLRALLDRRIVPDLVVGTSIGAINGAAVAQDPHPSVVDRLEHLWASRAADEVFGESYYRQMTRLARSGTHVHNPDALRAILAETLGERTRFEDLEVPLAVCAASIERAAEHWFDSGPVVDAVLASASVPAALPPAKIGDEHFVDGGVVNSIPLAQAVARGATTVYVLQVGRIEEQLHPPSKPSEVARVVFEIARRHRFQRERDEIPAHIDLHVLPYGGGQPGDHKLSAYRRMDRTHARIEAARAATEEYLAGVRAGA